MLREDNSYNAFEDVMNALKESINCSLPCQVEAVNGNYVDVRMIRNDDIEDLIISNVPIKREETARAYIFLGIKQGDRGTLTFYDKSIEDYILGDEDYNYDTRTHSIQDRCFSLGFVPDPEAFVYPENTDIEIGLKDGSAKITISDGHITISGGYIDIIGSKVSLGKNTTIDGKEFLKHRHSEGNQGGPTGGVI